MNYAITKEEINQKPPLEYCGPVQLIRDAQQVPAALEALQEETLLGFDTETRPAFRKGESYRPSLLQLGGADRVWIFQLRLLGDLRPLFALLEDKHLLKAGVAIARDVQELRDLTPFKPGGFEDVGHMAEKRGFQNTGLRPLAALLLNGRISKSSQVSNWAAAELSDKQITYAATDAWVSRHLYQALLDIPERHETRRESEVSRDSRIAK